MKESKKLNAIILTVNAILIAAVFIINYFYQRNDFNFTLKCVASSLFALLGLVNLYYAAALKSTDLRFYIIMAVGLILAMLGDVFIKFNFILGAAIFAVGHVFFLIAYCVLVKIKWLDWAISAVLFIGAGSFLLFAPVLTIKEPLLRWVCLAYAFIISLMLGKACANFIRQKQAFYLIIAVASLLFFFSDLMLLLDWFVGLWSWTNEACMATYYPALCLLAFSSFYKARYGEV